MGWGVWREWVVLGGFGVVLGEVELVVLGGDVDGVAVFVEPFEEGEAEGIHEVGLDGAFEGSGSVDGVVAVEGEELEGGFV